ncbi:MAG: patatin-like phospholipase family protein [Thermodesulfobacteriota bacterium]
MAHIVNDSTPSLSRTGEAMGLVLSGGGARGAYQLGCWKAFLERGLEFEAVAGSSIGALNGALICQGDWDAAYALWTDITSAPIVRPDYARLAKLAAALVTDVGLLLLPGPKLRALRLLTRAATVAKIMSGKGFVGLLQSEGLIQIERFRPILEDSLDMGKVLASRVKLFVTVTKQPGLTNPRGGGHWFTLQDHSAEEAFAILAASMALPLVFGPIELGGRYYRDGAIAHKFPVEPLYEMGLRRMVGVGTRAVDHYTQSDYPGCHITLIRPREPLGYFPFATFRFTPEALKEWMLRGYADAVAVLDDERNLWQYGTPR